MSADASSAEPMRGWFEAAVAILMGATSLTTAWCSYQSSRWDAQSSTSASEATKREREAAALHLDSQQVESVHEQLVTKAIDAHLSGNEKLFRFYTERMSAELKPAWEKWLASDPFANPAAPRHPFEPDLYQPRFQSEIEAARQQAADTAARSRDAGSHAAGYLALTPILAIILFFAGMAGTFKHRRVRRSSLGFAIILWLYVVIRMALLPVTQ